MVGERQLIAKRQGFKGEKGSSWLMAHGKSGNRKTFLKFL